MAHFAELDHNNVVLRVIVVDNRDTSTPNGTEKESIGAAHCEKIFGGRWVQTSYNGNFRKRYAGPGMIYHEGTDAFINPSPFPSWTLDLETANWVAPVPKPEGDYEWNETTGAWDPVSPPTQE
jgi:hypothetical protein